LHDPRVDLSRALVVRAVAGRCLKVLRCAKLLIRMDLRVNRFMLTAFGEQPPTTSLDGLQMYTMSKKIWLT
jgi:hypothetical protein